MTPRQHILDALLRVGATRGLDAVSVRSVATEAAVSPAQVQYYFSSKDRLLAAAFRHVHDRMGLRAAAVDPTGTPPEVLRRHLLTWLPLDGERRADASIWLAFTAAATTSPQLEEIVRETDAVVISALARLLAEGQTLGAFRPDLEPSPTASLLLAVVDGLTVRALTHPDPGLVLPVLDQFLLTLHTHPGA
ncbi:MAG: TetR/AcrR family transcriptional regulator [Arachnia sp.]